MSLLETADSLQVSRTKARELHKLYREHRVGQTPEDRQIETAYREIARGRVIIRALASIRAAGWNDAGLPKLAITRADAKRCRCNCWGSTTVVDFQEERRGPTRSFIRVRDMPQHRVTTNGSGVAIVPLIPIYLRPKNDLSKYWILWEADWRHAPADPLLLRKLTGDMWIVLAAWDLTDVERAALEQRVTS